MTTIQLTKFELIYLILFLARNFGSHCHSGLDPESILSNPCHPDLAFSPERSRTGQSRDPQDSIAKRFHIFVPLQLCYSKNENKPKTNPIQSQSKPIFQRSNFNFSSKMRIFDKFYKTLFMQNKANLQKLHSEYETPFYTKYAKQSQIVFETSIIGSWPLIPYQKACSMLRKSGEKCKPERIYT